MVLPPPRLHSLTNTTHKLTLAGILALSLSATSCGDNEDPLPEPEPPIVKPEPEPEPGEETKAGWLRLIPDWSEALTEATIPDSFWIRFDEGESRLYTAGTVVCSDSLNEAAHKVEAWNVPNYINVHAREAAVRTDEKGHLEAMPGYLFAASAEGMVTAGDTTDVSLRMRRLISPLRITLKFNEPYALREVECTLSGLLTSISLPDGQPVGPAGTSLFDWEILPDNQGIVLRLRTLGIYPKERQALEGRILLADGRTIRFQSDLSEELALLNEQKPIELENILHIEKPDEPSEPDHPDIPDEPWDPDTETGFIATMEDWKVAEGGNLEATEYESTN